MINSNASILFVLKVDIKTHYRFILVVCFAINPEKTQVNLLSLVRVELNLRRINVYNIHVQWIILQTFYGRNYTTSGIFLYDFD